ncbi:uncharacterized protein J4E92_006787 [Alternaria infectoria]|uniref:uncharacterized protein n=1 Tax=Alternaria infectoria TaxID=45303 RepID=UPI00221FBBEA|nr:uncharacterized protein J4E92_006787 [Alternaria infectoria]KAI4926050.1 hypothetical protein J4E92_006787 [Alternaria infectoria]
MASNIPDHWLWLGLGVFTFIAVQQVSHGLNNIRTLTEIRDPQNIPQQRRAIPSGPPTHQEDAIKTSSLLTLATSHNNDIRASATKILCTRFYASKSAKDLLIKDLYCADGEVLHRAQLAFNLLGDMGVWRDDGLLPNNRFRWDVVQPGVGSGSQRDLRRRRREAMVISDGEGLIGSDDVYMRGPEMEEEHDDEEQSLFVS